MKLLNTYSLVSIAAAATTLCASVHAQAPSAMDSAKMPAMTSGQATPATADMTEGVVRKIDKDNKKITLKHGDIKNLGMPGMTMVFQVKDPAMLEMVKAGDQVKFTAEKINGALVVTDIQPAQ